MLVVSLSHEVFVLTVKSFFVSLQYKNVFSPSVCIFGAYTGLSLVLELLLCILSICIYYSTVGSNGILPAGCTSRRDDSSLVFTNRHNR